MIKILIWGKDKNLSNEHVLSVEMDTCRKRLVNFLRLFLHFALSLNVTLLIIKKRNTPYMNKYYTKNPFGIFIVASNFQ